MRKWLTLSLLVGVTTLMATQGSAKVYSPWVISEQVADTRDEARFAEDSRWADLTGQEKALAVWRYLTDQETGTWHYSDMWEGRDPYWESKLVKDPVKILNVYGFSVCTMHASMIEGLYEALGFGVRQQEFGGYHRTAEVEWEGKWHYLDVDERAYLIDNEGRVLSVTEAVNHPEFWERSAEMVSPFYPQNGGIKGIQELAKRKPGVIHWHWRTLGHSMDFSLRPGESLTRYWQGQGRWRVSGAWQNQQSLKLLSRPPAGPKTARRISSNNSYGNGVWRYQPDLTSGYADFHEGVYRTRNVKQDGKGVTLAGAGTGWVEWRVRTPYIIVPDPKDLADPDDDEGAAVVRFSASGPVQVKVSIDGGRHWETALVREGNHHLGAGRAEQPAAADIGDQQPPLHLGRQAWTANRGDVHRTRVHRCRGHEAVGSGGGRGVPPGPPAAESAGAGDAASEGAGGEQAPMAPRRRSLLHAPRGRVGATGSHPLRAESGGPMACDRRGHSAGVEQALVLQHRVGGRIGGAGAGGLGAPRPGRRRRRPPRLRPLPARPSGAARPGGGHARLPRRRRAGHAQLPIQSAQRVSGAL